MTARIWPALEFRDLDALQSSVARIMEPYMNLRTGFSATALEMILKAPAFLHKQPLQEVGAAGGSLVGGGYPGLELRPQIFGRLGDEIPQAVCEAALTRRLREAGFDRLFTVAFEASR